MIQTAKDSSDRLTVKEPVSFVQDDEIENKLINIYEDRLYQEIEGFGGAFTEAGAVTLDKMSPQKRKEVIEAYFDQEKGLGYTLCRTHINSCDFSTGNYAYSETEDIELKNFSIERDKKSLIPFIKDAMKTAQREIKLFASPWSPPGWMKTTGIMNRGGKLKEEMREVWAKYYVKYIGEYAKEGIKIWGLTVQNEPKATQTWDSCVYTAEEERDFVKYFLGPELHRSGLGDVKLMIWDHNRERVYERSKLIYSDPEAAKYVWGTAFHWYSGEHFEGLSITHEAFPDKKLLFSEGCCAWADHGSWSVGEAYGHDIIGNLNNWAVGFVDWNMVLDENGGPNHVGNYCNAPIIADTRSDTLTYESSYYYIGHFSKYIRPGARRVGFSRYTDKLEVTAFKNTNGEMAVVVMNRNNEEIEFYLRCEHGVARFVSRPHSIMTLIY